MKNILIIGAGIAGLTAALSFAKKGTRVTVLEKNKTNEAIGAAIQLSPNAMKIIQALKLDKDLEKTACAPLAATTRHFKTGKPYFSLPLNTPPSPEYGAPYLHIHRQDLIRSLLKANLQEGVIIKTGEDTKHIINTDKNVQLKTMNGTRFMADILIGADGIHSHVRRHLFGTQHTQAPHFTGQTAWRGIVPSASIAPHTIAPHANIWVGAGQHFVAYYICGGKMINFVAVKEVGKMAEWAEENWQVEGDITVLREAFSGWDPALVTLLGACEKTHLWGLFDRPPLKNTVKRRAILIGDASHPMLPFMAQGGALAIEDGYRLAQMITNTDDIAEGLKKFQNQRRARVTQIYKMVQTNTRLFHAQSPVRRLQRNILYKLAHFFPHALSAHMGKIYKYDATSL